MEEELGLPLDEAAEVCTAFLEKMKQDETLNKEIHTSLITGPRSGINIVALPPDT